MIDTIDGKIVEDYQSVTATDFVKSTFEEVEERLLQLDQKKSMEAGKAINAIGKEMKPMKIPANPVKAAL